MSSAWTYLSRVVRLELQLVLGASGRQVEAPRVHLLLHGHRLGDADGLVEPGSTQIIIVSIQSHFKIFFFFFFFENQVVILTVLVACRCGGPPGPRCRGRRTGPGPGPAASRAPPTPWLQQQHQTLH